MYMYSVCIKCIHVYTCLDLVCSFTIAISLSYSVYSHLLPSSSPPPPSLPPFPPPPPRPQAERGSIGTLRQEDKSLLQKAARTGSLHDDEEDDELEHPVRLSEEEGHEALGMREVSYN